MQKSKDCIENKQMLKKESRKESKQKKKSGVIEPKPEFHFSTSSFKNKLESAFQPGTPVLNELCEFSFKESTLSENQSVQSKPDQKSNGIKKVRLSKSKDSNSLNNSKKVNNLPGSSKFPTTVKSRASTQTDGSFEESGNLNSNLLNNKSPPLMNQNQMTLKDIEAIVQSYSKIYSLSQSNFDINNYLSDDEKIYYNNQDRLEDGRGRPTDKKRWFSGFGGKREYEREEPKDKSGRRKKVTVVVVFVVTILLGLAVFFFWPRVPTITATDVYPSGFSQTVFNQDTSEYGLTINARVQYTITSGSFYQQTINLLSMQVLSAVTGASLGSGNAKAIIINSMETKTFFVNTQISYFASVPNDNTMYTLLKSCAASNTTLPTKYARKSEALSLNINSKINLAGIAVKKSHSVSNIINLLCPK
ncbi:hypothetical protein BB561_004023 [Smittium simulii]|uniref:Late embryogenesis abundant protein LEA-2 subgroup domain-containing protein n=1 Tax=Smittium simulii TaxID=133385 RepID=A0A2T9YID6_9FUNG|nr:hypothetical protein BB561_004023 [Smittium simulii]